MKKSLHLGLAAIVSMSAMAQSNYSGATLTPKQAMMQKAYVGAEMESFYKKASESVKNPTVDPATVDIKDLGRSGNTFTCAFGARANVWADPQTNTIVFIHRSDPTHSSMSTDASHGFYRYDVSFDGGSTWQANQGPVYKSNGQNTPPNANARYPMALIYNPSGNTTGSNAFISFYGPSLTSTNGGSWGGNVYGSMKLDGSGQKQTEKIFKNSIIPDDFMIGKNGKSYVCQSLTSYDSLAGGSYTDSVMVSIGTWGSGDYSYAHKTFYMPMAKEMGGASVMLETRIAMADDGNKGYLATLGHYSFTNVPDSLYYITVFTTTDGGNTWGNPVEVNLSDKVDGLLLNAGNTTVYGTGFNFEAICDKNGNLHMVVPVHAVGDASSPAQWSVATGPNSWGMFDIYTNNGGTNWFAKKLGNPFTLTGSFGISGDATNPEVREYNRQTISRTWDGSKLFFTWFDTDTNKVGADPDALKKNRQPDMFVVGYDVDNDKYTNPINISENTSADAFVTFGNVSYYALENGGNYSIPTVYGEMTGGDPNATGSPLSFKYLFNEEITNANFDQTNDAVQVVSVNEISNNVAIINNYPNPFSKFTTIDISLKNNSDVTVNVYNTMGQLVITKVANNLSAGVHGIRIDAGSLASGLYTYTVDAGNSIASGKMTIE